MVGFPKFSQFWKFLGFHSGGFGAPSCTWVKPAQSTDDDLADFLGDFGAWVTFGGRLVALNVDGTRCAMRE